MATSAIVWFRRDLRLADNPALDYAREHYARVIPVYIHDPEGEGTWAPGAASTWWLHHSLTELAGRLEDRGARLVIRAGTAPDALAALVDETGADAVVWNRLYEPALVERDSRIKAELEGRGGLEVHSFRANVLFEPWELVRGADQPYKVFTPYWKRMQKAWRPVATRREPRRLAGYAQAPKSLSVDDLALLSAIRWDDGLAAAWEPGELGARRRLRDFADEAVTRYDDQRNRPDRPGTSALSPHLHFGEVSPAQVCLAMAESGELPDGKGRLAWVREIAWREFSVNLLYHFPRTPDEPLQAKFAGFPWRTNYADDLAAWQAGRTGVPMVDAGMRELWHTGWMHNRVRMVAASFLIKNLLIPWQDGAAWFWDTLVDADLANNTQGWQWTAGCGADAAPYFRIFNPVTQGRRFDPAGEYVRIWIPELAGLPDRHIHAPWDAPADILEQAGVRLGEDYPMPIVDLKGSRRRALEAYEGIKG